MKKEKKKRERFGVARKEIKGHSILKRKERGGITWKPKFCIQKAAIY